MKDFATEEKLTVREQREKTERILKRVASSSALMMFATGLSGCFRDEGGSSSSGTSFTGSVFDGPLKSAKVFIDANNNGLLDENEDWTLTSSDGSYSLSTSTTGNLAVKNHAYGIQFHIEVDENTIFKWSKVPELKTTLEKN